MNLAVKLNTMLKALTTTAITNNVTSPSIVTAADMRSSKKIVTAFTKTLPNPRVRSSMGPKASFTIGLINKLMADNSATAITKLSNCKEMEKLGI